MGSATALGSDGGAPGRLCAVLRRAPLLVRALEVARAVDAPDWLIMAGAIRDVVWDVAHGRPPTATPNDVDLGFFDAADLSTARDEVLRAELAARGPEIPWQAKNQAAVHVWYPDRFGTAVAPFRSCAEAVATFPETASSVGVRLLDDDDMLVVAPHGLDDLLECVCRHNPTRVSAAFYEQRVVGKGWAARWPKMRYVAPTGSSAASAGAARSSASPS